MLYIIRHGQTKMNKKNLLQGRTDAPLNDEGRLQAEELKAFFASKGIVFSQVYSSPLIRAVETARIVTGNSEIKTDERLLEMDYGPYEGTDLTHIPPELLYFFMDFVNHPAPTGMESLESVVRRGGTFLEDLKAAHPGEDILISTHAVSMKGLLEYLTPDSNGSYWSETIANCAVFAAEETENGFAVPELIR